MTDNEKTALLEAVLKTLDSLTVTGLENMEKVLGCSEAIKDVVGALGPMREPAKEAGRAAQAAGGTNGNGGMSHSG